MGKYPSRGFLGIGNLKLKIGGFDNTGIAYLTSALAVENGFVKQAPVSSLLHEYGFDEEGICELVKSKLLG